MVAERQPIGNESMELESSARLYTLLWSAGKVFHRWFAAKALKAAARDEGRMLDVACGPGFLPIVFSRLAPSWHATGLDIAPTMLREARTRVAKMGLQERVRIVEGSALEMPFEDDTFDLVTITNALHMFADVDPLLAEVRRVLVPGGVFFAQSFVRDPFLPIRWGAALNTMLFEAAGTKLEGMKSVFAASYTVGEIEEAAERAGLEGRVHRSAGYLLMAELRK